MPSYALPVAIVFIVLVLLVFANAWLTQKKPNANEPQKPSDLTSTNGRLPYRKLQFLTNAERSFYGVLLRAAGPDVAVFAKVRLADLVGVESGTPSYNTHFNKISKKHVDFVLCDAASVSPFLVIELDDSSHKRSDREDRDALVDDVLAAAGLRIMRVPAKEAYDERALAEQLRAQGVFIS